VVVVSVAVEVAEAVEMGAVVAEAVEMGAEEVDVEASRVAPR
jgi:hypothetical protein